MWTIIKFDKTKLASLKNDLKLKLGEDLNIYIPKIVIKVVILRTFSLSSYTLQATKYNK